MFWDNFKNLCDEMGMKPTPVLKECGISTGSIGRWQSGSSPNADAVIAIAEYFKCSTDILLRGFEFSRSTEFCISRSEEDFLKMYRALPESTRDFVHGAVKQGYDNEMRHIEEEKKLS